MMAHHEPERACGLARSFARAWVRGGLGAGVAAWEAERRARGLAVVLAGPRAWVCAPGVAEAFGLELGARLGLERVRVERVWFHGVEAVGSNAFEAFDGLAVVSTPLRPLGAVAAECPGLDSAQLAEAQRADAAGAWLQLAARVRFHVRPAHLLSAHGDRTPLPGLLVADADPLELVEAPHVEGVAVEGLAVEGLAVEAPKGGAGGQTSARIPRGRPRLAAGRLALELRSWPAWSAQLGPVLAEVLGSKDARAHLRSFLGDPSNLPATWRAWRVRLPVRGRAPVWYGPDADAVARAVARWAPLAGVELDARALRVVDADADAQAEAEGEAD
jgi:hypothetical protein